MRRKLRIRRVSLASMLKFTMVLGAVLSVLPAILLSWLTGVGISVLRDFLASLSHIEVANILGRSIELDLIQQLQLTGLNGFVTQLDDRWAIIQPLLALVLIGAGIVGWAGAGVVAGLLYNILSFISGGLMIEVEAQDIAPLPDGLPSALKRDTLLS